MQVVGYSRITRLMKCFRAIHVGRGAIVDTQQVLCEILKVSRNFHCDFYGISTNDRKFFQVIQVKYLLWVGNTYTLSALLKRPMTQRFRALLRDTEMFEIIFLFERTIINFESLIYRRKLRFFRIYYWGEVVYLLGTWFLKIFFQ